LHKTASCPFQQSRFNPFLTRFSFAESVNFFSGQDTGPAPDSMRIDADGNLYVAMHRQGRFMVFDPVGMPIGQILISG
jgi:sugar lactone lactonase YvrE